TLALALSFDFEPAPTAESLARGLLELPPVLMWPMLVAMLTLAPIVEESLFRHYLFYRVLTLPGGGRRGRPALAIAVTSLLFAAVHTGAVDPYWLKFAQILLPGV